MYVCVYIYIYVFHPRVPHAPRHGKMLVCYLWIYRFHIRHVIIKLNNYMFSDMISIVEY